ncbi:23S rRNA (guanosine(2251)-2'-O)-methyltransferase RlmB [Segetibacter sp. 3557_3]|uniref:23S rRNA (guanosine(2251)-2'-O)-methyltransferase RlmB n=1 Tax=Segetibacter sp. 3557_3 TaxID=2547429 RepID=UPI001058AD2D|nr:23S rRNA (guanosine(2251)-2'-O)-methyltransferase RlmB [Segetibacter sp. 3557_3]TDH28862.1 23S rRNA (guanosine(2251)-2'-O)-methyltransferase RlmB [Segetibacter sp. 3557_3]
MNFRNQAHKPRPKKNTLVIGRLKVIEAIQNGVQLEKIYLVSTVHGDTIDEVKRLALEYQVPINKVPVAKLNGFNISNHEGCVAVLSKVQYQDLQQVISFVFDKGEVPLFLLLDGITDVRNIGAIARTAYCSGVHALIIPDKGVGALNEDAVFTSAGALEQIAVCRVSSLVKAVEDLHLNGIKVYASEMKADKNVFDLPLFEPSAIVMGSEDKGIQPALSKACDERFKVPMMTDFESLNVSVATGMILYESIKQRLTTAASGS